MRYSPNSFIWDTWSSGGPFIGKTQAVTRITVEPNWYLNQQGDVKNISGPVRWFQRSDNEQYEVEVPNVKSVSIDRSFQSDSATCSISLNNQWHYQNGEVSSIEDLGQPGFFTFMRGQTSTSEDRWHQQTNFWSDILVPNALIRTYQGYGGNDSLGRLQTQTRDSLLTEDGMPIQLEGLNDVDYIPTAVANGNLVLSGTWLIDSIDISNSGEIQIRCRDMAKLLIEQQIFPPLTPSKEWPLSFARYQYPTFKNPTVTYGAASVSQKGFYYDTARYYSSSLDYVTTFAQNRLYNGHRPSHAIDLDSSKYYLSEGKSAKTDSVSIEFIVNAPLNRVSIAPFGGGYTVGVDVSEMSSGTLTWRGAPFVAVANLKNSNQSTVIDLPQTYQAVRVKLVFTNLQKMASLPRSSFDEGDYRAGIIEARFGELKTQRSLRNIVAIGQSRIAISDKNSDAYKKFKDAQGYWLAGDDGGVYAVGPHISSLGSAAAAGSIPNDLWCDLAVSYGDVGGYWLLTQNGRVTAYGGAALHTDSTGLTDLRTKSLAVPAVAIDVPTSNRGYYVLTGDGRVHRFGAVAAAPLNDHHNDPIASVFDVYGRMGSVNGIPVFAVDFASVGVDGYYILDSKGVVHAFGSAHWFGDSTTKAVSGTMVAISVYYDSTNAAAGYWVLNDSGKVFAFGAAKNLGNASVSDAAVDICQSQHQEMGYIIASADGNVYNFGTADRWGDILPNGSNNYQLAVDGNYLDYSDIVKRLLLWSGWWLEGTYEDSGTPSVYGNIEDTGIFSDTALPESMFDKRPVIDAIHEIKQIVGYNFWCDEAGGARFELPTWYTPGNFINETGAYTSFVPSVDELTNLLSYSATFNDQSVRSQIIVSTSDPLSEIRGTLTSILNAESIMLRGMTKPMMFGNEMFLNQQELDIMAEMVAMQINFQQRTGQVTCIGNPLLQLSDKIRIFERTTSESFVHYIRGISSTHDLESGAYTQTLTTNWLGNFEEGSWAIRFEKGKNKIGPQRDGTFIVSEPTKKFIQASRNRQVAYSNIIPPVYIETPAPTTADKFVPNHQVVGWNVPLYAASDYTSRIALWDRIESTGANIVRLDAYWPLLQPTNPTNAVAGQNDAFDSTALANLDSLMDDAAERGVFVWLNCAYTPAWARTSFPSLPGGLPAGADHQPPDRNPEHGYPDFANFVWHIVDRYESSHPGTLAAVGIWNEPNISQFWMQPPGTGTQANVNYSPDAGRYAKLLIGAYDAVKNGVVYGRSNRSSYPDMIVTTGGTAPASGSGNGSNYLPATFVSELFDEGAGNSFDHIDHHPYCWQFGPGETGGAFDQMHDIWSVAQSNGRTDVLIWCSEIGIISRPNNSGTNPSSPGGVGGYSSSPPSGSYITSADAITYSLAATRVDEIFQAWRSSSFYDVTNLKHILGPMVWYRINDESNGINTTWSNPYAYFGFYEWGTNALNGPAKGSMVSAWQANALPDVSAPTAEIVSPKDGAFVSGIVPIVITAGDDRDVYVEKVEVFVDGVLAGQATPGFGYIYSLDSTTALNGTRYIQVRATDNAGNYYDTTPIKVVVQNVGQPNGTTDFRSRGSINAIGLENAQLWDTSGSAFEPPVNAFYVDAVNGDDSNTGATLASAVQNLDTAVVKVNSGTVDRTICLATGDYRTGHQSITASSRVLGIQALQNAQCWIKGSNIFDSSDWSYQGFAWAYNQTYVSHGFDQLFVDGVPYAQVFKVGDLKSGCFYVDGNSKRIYVGEPSTWAIKNHIIEVCVRGFVLGNAVASNTKDSFYYKGVGFAHWATDARVSTNAAVRMCGENQSLTNVTFAYCANNALDITNSTSLSVDNCIFIANGGSSLRGENATSISVQNVRSEWCNWKGTRSPSLGAIEFVRSSQIDLNNIIVANSIASGITFSTNCSNVNVQKVYSCDNHVYGLSFELSSGLMLVDAIFARNVEANYRVLGSPNCSIWHVTSLDSSGSAVGLYEDSLTFGSNPNLPASVGDTFNVMIKNCVHAGSSNSSSALFDSKNIISGSLPFGAIQQLAAFTTQQMFATNPHADPLSINAGSNVWIRTGSSTALPQFAWAVPSTGFAGSGYGTQESKTLSQVKSLGCESNSISIDNSGSSSLSSYFPNYAIDDNVAWTATTIPGSGGTSSIGAVPTDAVTDIIGIAHGSAARYGCYNPPRPQ